MSILIHETWKITVVIKTGRGTDTVNNREQTLTEQLRAKYRRMRFIIHIIKDHRPHIKKPTRRDNGIFSLLCVAP